MKYDLETLKQLPIRDIAASLGIEIRGTRANARCFNQAAHPQGDKKPSLGFDNNSNRFKCFSCGVQGSTIDLVMQTQGVGLSEACDLLAGMYGITGENSSSQNGKGKNLTKLNISRVSYADQKPQYEPPTEIDIEVYSLFYEKCSPLSAEGVKLLTSKGFTAETIRQFGWRSISAGAIDAVKKGFTSSEVETSGIPGLFYPGWLLIPFWQDDGLCYLRCRNAAKKDFRNLSGKSTQPYNYNALYGLTSSNSLYVCEGETDTMTLAQNGYCAIGILGATQNETVRRVAELITEGFGTELDIILVFDNDEQGRKATELARKELTNRGCIPKRLKIPSQYKDINDYCNDRPLTTPNEK